MTRKARLSDEAIVLYFAAPRSYTCEEVVEFQCHGGEIIGSKVLSQCLALGARIARAGEFTKRAYLNGRLDLAQANAIARMISTGDKSSKCISQAAKRRFRSVCKASAHKPYKGLAHTEVMIDYSEEDIPSDIITRIHSMLECPCHAPKQYLHLFQSSPQSMPQPLPYRQAKCRQVLLA